MSGFETKPTVGTRVIVEGGGGDGWASMSRGQTGVVMECSPMFADVVFDDGSKDLVLWTSLAPETMPAKRPDAALLRETAALLLRMADEMDTTSEVSFDEIADRR